MSLTGQDNYFGFPITYFSSKITQIITQNHEKTDAQKAETILQLWYRNKFDWFVPIITQEDNYHSINEAMKRMRGCSKSQSIPLNDLFIDESTLG